MLSVAHLEKEFEGPESGFRVFQPTTEKSVRERPRAHFLRNKRLKRECVVQKAHAKDVLLTPALLRSIDKADLKQTEFHRLWLCGFVDRFGRGTAELKKAILKQTCEFDGEPKIGDAQILRVVDDARESWKAMVVRKLGWSALYLAASLQKAGWFDERGCLSVRAIEFYGEAQKKIAFVLSKKATTVQLDMLVALGKYGRLIFTSFFTSTAATKQTLRETQAAVSWAHANRLIDTNWSLTHLGMLVLKNATASRTQYEERLCS